MSAPDDLVVHLESADGRRLSETSIVAAGSRTFLSHVSGLHAGERIAVVLHLPDVRLSDLTVEFDVASHARGSKVFYRYESYAPEERVTATSACDWCAEAPSIARGLLDSSSCAGTTM
jgi:hypothetical protein